MDKINTKHPLYQTWVDMKRRCFNKNRKAYKDYGARGITVCDEWVDSFENFVLWSLSNGWENGLTIDRKNVNGDYEPANCRYITKSINSSSDKQNSIYITFENQTLTLAEWSRKLNIPYSTLYFRIIVHKKPISQAFKQDENIFWWEKDMLETVQYEPTKHQSLKEATAEFEYHYVKSVMSSCKNKSMAADILGIDRKTLYNKLSQNE